MSGFAHFIFSTPGLVWTLSLAAIWIALRPGSRVARRSAIAIAVAYLLVSVYAVPSFFSRLLARPYHRLRAIDVPRGRVAVVVFGAGDEEVAGWDGHVAIPNSVAASRALEAQRVFQLLHAEWIISSGGNPDGADEPEPSSVNLRNLLVSLGVPASRIILESMSRETHENAALTATILRHLRPDAVILVTSASHMRRAIGAMRAAGIDPIPAIAPDSWYEHGWTDTLLPSNHGLYFSGEVVHELIGIPYYRLRGWYR